MSLFHFIGQFFGDSANWSGADGIPQRIWEHVLYTLMAMGIATVIALPLGLVTGHTGRGGNVLAFLATAARALPTLGLLVLLTLLWGIGMLPVMVPLVALAVPPILVTSYEAIRTVDRSLVDAAQGMGMGAPRVLFQVEIPVALPLILSGLRSAAVQTVATTTIAAAVSFGGLGRYIYDGLSEENYAQAVGGSTLVVVLALVTVGLFWVVGRVFVSPGVRRSGAN
jgi:osmoprotectant transport system permease protein